MKKLWGILSAGLLTLGFVTEINAQAIDEDPTVNPVVSAQATADGYDVILLAGQSNMAGRATASSPDADAATNPRIFMWHPISGIVPAQDPLVHQEPRKTNADGSFTFIAGPGLTFAKEYIKTIPSNRKVLLVGAVYGGTGFMPDVTASTQRWNFTLKKFESVTNLHHRWMPTDDPATGGDLYRGAIRRANEAMTAAGLNARFVGILWHQGENDAVYDGADTYATNHGNLINALRSNITGADSRTPVVVGEFNP
ncbi:MAG: sialate O-acetylesterase [Pseudomonadota bacterium]